MSKFAKRERLNLSEINKEVLEEWKAQDVFHRSMSEREGCPSFIFFEGPPSANGHPGIHHVMARSLKDTICRYKTMEGYQVKRKAGWDTHGLPVELGVEKELGITKEDIGKTISIEEDDSRHLQTTINPATTLEETEDEQWLRQKLKQLPTTQHTILYMRQVERLSAKEISERLGIAETSVSTLLARARRSLLEEIKRRYNR